MMSVHISSGLVLHQMTSDHNRSELGIQDHSNEPSSSKLVPKVVPLAVKTATSRQELESLFHLHIAMLRTTGGVRVARENDRGVTEGREDIREVFQQCGNGAKRELSRCGRNQMGNKPILALPEGADNFVVYYDVRSKDLEACLEKGECDCLYVASTEVEYQGSLGLLLQPELPEWKWEMITKDIVVKLPSVSGGYDAIWV
ncbi:hypothetical protein Tco_1504138 [Tanacetum coccineum]